MKKVESGAKERGRREVYEHMDAFLRLSYSQRGRWLGEALALVDAVKDGRIRPERRSRLGRATKKA